MEVHAEEMQMYIEGNCQDYEALVASANAILWIVLSLSLLYLNLYKSRAPFPSLPIL